jgi:hypothetical protein
MLLILTLILTHFYPLINFGIVLISDLFGQVYIYFLENYGTKLSQSKSTSLILVLHTSILLIKVVMSELYQSDLFMLQLSVTFS